MIVSHAKRFIFLHNPKCAGMSFREALNPYHDDAVSFWAIQPAPYFRNHIDYGHLRLWELHALHPDLFECAAEYASVITVRNPHARFLAALNEHFKKFQGAIDLAGMPAPRRVAVLEEFIVKMLTIARITTDWRFVHFSPQTWFIHIGGRTIPRHIVPMIGGGFAAAAMGHIGLPDLPLPWQNRSPLDLSLALASPVVTRFVETFYTDDIAFFRADPALAELAAPAGTATPGPQ